MLPRVGIPLSRQHRLGHSDGNRANAGFLAAVAGARFDNQQHRVRNAIQLLEGK